MLNREFKPFRGTVAVLVLIAAGGALAGCASQGPEVTNALASSSGPAATSAIETTAAVDTTKIQTISAVDRSKVVEATKALTAAATPGNNAYKIGPQDVLDISVFQVPELQRTVQVAELGHSESAAGG